MSENNKYYDRVTFGDTVYQIADTEARKSIETIKSTMVPVEDGKGLSTNDFSDYYKQTLETSAKTIDTHASSTSNPHKVTAKQVGLENLTNDKQAKGLSSGTTAGNVVVWGADGYSVKDSGFTIKKSVPADAVFTDTVYTHPSIAAKSESSSETLKFGGSFKALGSVTVNSEGHVTDFTTKTITFPAETTLSTADSGTGNVVTGIAVEGHKITVSKGSVATSDHTHNYAGAAYSGGPLTSGISWESATANTDRDIWISDNNATDKVGKPAYDKDFKYNPVSNTLKVPKVCIGGGCTVDFDTTEKCLNFVFG